MNKDNGHLFTRLEELGIRTTTHDHPPLHTVEESKKYRGQIPGAHIKNLFFKMQETAALAGCGTRRCVDRSKNHA